MLMMRIIGVALAGGLLLYQAQPAPTPAAPPPDAPAAPIPHTDREAWAVAFLAALGNTAPTPDTIRFIVAWTIAEDGSGGALARGNPLNTTMPSQAETQIINGDGVRGYASEDAGIAASVATITNGLYGELLAGLQTNDPARAKAGLFASPWAESHYGYGAGWPKETR